MNGESALRARVREAMRTGELPEQGPERIWGGPGSGAPCAVCGRTVGNQETEFELQFASDRDSGDRNCRVHAKCFAAWELERRNGDSDGHSLPQEGNEGMMPGSGHNTKTPGERG